ncbi:Fic family protein [Pedobacter gandavensis]|uniref:Fic family protein n=1 Tax=Pedobacter gandavensis TaxID=2679963 RepID=UPI00292FE3E7|nr:Fic family protein [Pedobacter gandavensis]
MELRSAGNLWLQEKLGLKQFSISHRSYIGSNGKIELAQTGEINQIYGIKYAPSNDMVPDHLEFALKYDDLNLFFLKKVFQHTDPQELINYIEAAPSGRYARRIGFLYEFLTQKELDLNIEITGNYVDLLSTQHYITGESIKNKRWKINDNLLGTVDFCPVIKRTEHLDELLKFDLKAGLSHLKEAYSPEIFHRATNYLYNKETRSSYEIEKEKPTPQRMERFISLLMQAGREAPEETLSEEKLKVLQNAIVDPRFAAPGFRDFQNYIEMTLPGYIEQVQYICPPPQYVASMMQGLRALPAKTQGTPSMVRSAIIAFGFVFIHPFEDGNGRLHRFLIHDMLVRDGLVSDGLIIPISAHMLNHIKEYDRVLENYSRPLMRMIKYTKTDAGEITVENPEEIESYFRYPDLTAQSTFLAETIKATLTEDMPDELLFIQRYDQLKSEIQQIVDMPDKAINSMIVFLHQNKGAFPKRRRKDFEKLLDEEIQAMEEIYRELFNQK